MSCSPLSCVPRQQALYWRWKTGVIRITCAEDLLELSRNCALDTWSQGKHVALTADISLAGTGYTPIPTFGGTFDGGGYTISGLDLSSG